MKQSRGVVDIALALIVAGAFLIGSLCVADKPRFNCSVYTSQNEKAPEECKLAQKVAEAQPEDQRIVLVEAK